MAVSGRMQGSLSTMESSGTCVRICGCGMPVKTDRQKAMVLVSRFFMLCIVLLWLASCIMAGGEKTVLRDAFIPLFRYALRCVEEGFLKILKGILHVQEGFLVATGSKE